MQQRQNDVRSVSSAASEALEAARAFGVICFLGVVCLLATLWWMWRKHMGRKPSEVTQAIKAKVASVKATRTHPVAEQGAAISEAPSVVPETEAHCPQGAPWCCSVCGNVATGPVCTVDGAKGNA